MTIREHNADRVFLSIIIPAYNEEARIAKSLQALASYIDPVHPDLVELRDHLLTARIRFRASDITNARGRVSGP